MDSSLTTAQQEIREAILKICAGFGEDYWLERDRDGEFPHAFHRAVAGGGWPPPPPPPAPGAAGAPRDAAARARGARGAAMPGASGGASLGIAEAALMMQAIAESGAAFSGASALHMNIF